MCQPTARKAVRLQALLPAKPEDRTQGDSIDKLSVSRTMFTISIDNSNNWLVLNLKLSYYILSLLSRRATIICYGKGTFFHRDQITILHFCLNLLTLHNTTWTFSLIFFFKIAHESHPLQKKI